MMNIILDELNYAERLLAHGFSRYMRMKDLIVLAKYFRYLGKNDLEVKGELLNFCNKFIDEFTESIYAEKIEKALIVSSKVGLRVCADVPVTERELQMIRKLKNYRYEKVLFTMLVLGKYYYLTNPGNKNARVNRYYVNLDPKEILRRSRTSLKRGENIFHRLYRLGLLDAVM